MSRRIKIISGTEAGAVVNQVNKLLSEGWKHLNDFCVTVHSPNSQPMLVPCYVFYLYLEENGKQ